MVITKLSGGLGNQMFQYAVGRAIAHRNKSDLGLDISWFKYNIGNEKRDYGLSNFNIIENIKNQNFYIQKLKSRLSFLENFKKCENRKYFKEKTVSVFNKDSLCLSGYVFLEGYWQNFKYFADIEYILRQEFTLKKELDNEIARIIQKENSVSIHIRRGDYISNPLYNKLNIALSLDYYQKTIEIISQKVFSPHFFIFSDDIDWAKENLKLEKATFIGREHNFKDYEELILMSKCEHNIISNSTFSWWAAWLNNNPEKIVIAPLKWSGDMDVDVKGLIPDSWIKI